MTRHRQGVASACAFGILSLLALSGCGGETRVEVIGVPTATRTSRLTPTTPSATATERPPIPTATTLPTAANTATRVPTATFTRTPTTVATTPARTSTPTPSRTLTATVPATATRTLSATSTLAPTATATVPPSPTATTTSTRVPPTATATVTATRPAPTNTPVASATSTATLAPTSTATLSGPTAPPSATFSPTPTLTPGGATPTPTATTNPCNANGLLEAGETCETCAADCAIKPCTAVTPLRSFRVDLAPPAFQDPSSITVQVSYRSNLVSLPGSGSAPAARVRSRPSGATVTPNDLDYALRVVESRAGGLTAGRLFIVDFDSCSGALVPTTADFVCIVTGCSNSSGPISGCTCSVLNP